MFQKILIANRGDSRQDLPAAAKTDAGRKTGVRSKPQRLVSKANGDRAAE